MEPELPQQPAPHQAQANPPPQLRAMDNRLQIPAMNHPANQLAFGRLDCDFQVVDLIAQVENQDDLARATYQQILATLTIDLTMTEAQFIRMWKTIYLKRLQDVFEAEKHIRHANFIRIGRQIPLPAPLADLCHATGHFNSAATGHHYHVNPPAAPAAPEPWRQVNNNLVALWTRELQRCAPNYQMKEFPAPNQCADRPLMLTTQFVENDFSIVKAWTNEPKPTDGYIRTVNNDLYDRHAYINYDNSSLNMTQRVHVPSVRAQYAGSYVLDSNS